MASLNKVFIIGNLVQEPELRYTQIGQAVATLRIASTRRFRTKAGELKDETLFINVEVWGRQAENCGEFLSKGRPVFIEGRLVQDNWETKDGQRRTTYKIVASNVQFLPSGRRDTTELEETLDTDESPGEADLDTGAEPEDTIPDDIPF